MLTASGISGYCIRVALGSLHISLADGTMQRHDHSWVMYQNESAVWEILEPTAAIGSRPGKQAVAAVQRLACGVEYVPHYVFNADHLWQIHSRESVPDVDFGDYCKSGEFWRRFDPDFAAGVHNTIFDQALGTKIPAAALGAIKRKSLCLDVNILTYDPRDHFDNGFIKESWDQVRVRLAAFRKNNDDWDSFGAAAHSIGDFYAHSSYLHFAILQNAGSNTGQAKVFAPDVGLVGAPQYTAVPADPSLPPFDLTSDSFSLNPYFWKGTKQQAASQLAGQLISGRYAQKHDPQEGFFEHFTSIPSQLTQRPDFPIRGALPHHNEIAVDDPAMGSGHRLYSGNSSGPTDRRAYANQFLWRKNTAIQHIREALLQNHPSR